MEHRKIIQHWPTTVMLAEELGLPVTVVQKWKDRNKVPSKHWKPILVLWKRRAYKLEIEARTIITLEDFV